ncbi:uncharacterized protein LOC121235396 [Juglans microcarpa x Juglans regia]|uniref:uncharacterized protein LOC121235396 n=1 Tax=Juglans microcarpa x Juglans regia TaxID=2249226 RepID=UPI001B7DF985|nr:uncharacterized protein LOC121235396 [Juglans microcarpa x Juglans regia]
MDKLHEMWENLQLNEEEGVAIDIEVEGIPKVLHKGDRSLISKIWSDRQIGKNIIETTMAKVWRLSKPAIFIEMGKNIFVITFATHADKNRVMSGRPWFFDGQMFVLKVFDGYTPLNKMSFDDVVLWVQFHNLPLFGMSWECGERMGSSLGVVEEVEVDGDDVGWGRFLRVKILLNLKKPLAKGWGWTITLQGLKTWIPIQYEKLPRFCLKCGRIVHEEKGCPVPILMETSNRQFGSWLRVESGGWRFRGSSQTWNSSPTKSSLEGKGKATVVEGGEKAAVNGM